MVPLLILRITLVSALLFTSVSGQCRVPRVRREWRCISPDERASWIKAVKVFLPLARVTSVISEFCISVPCQDTPRSRGHPRRRPRDFIDTTSQPEQFLL